MAKRTSPGNDAMPAPMEYEKFCVQIAQDTHPGSTAWHWLDVPEEELLASGWRLRPGRHSRRVADGGYCDFGLDGLLRVAANEYSGLQMKLYGERTTWRHDPARRALLEQMGVVF